MKIINDILAVIFLVLTITFYCGQDVIDNYKYMKSKIEKTENNKESHNMSSLEIQTEDAPCIFFKAFIQFVNLDYESVTSLACNFPPKLYYSIWLPPDIS